MNGLWHTVVRINARYLALGAAAVLALAMLAWLLSLAPPRPRPGETGGGSTAAPAGETEDARPVLAQDASTAPAPNPFESNHLSELVALSDEGLLRWDTPSAPAPEAKPEPPPPEEPAKAPEPRTVQLAYLGMMTRTDGATVAIVEKEGEPRPATYPAGAVFIDGVRIAEVQRSHITIEVGGKTVTLLRGARMALEY